MARKAFAAIEKDKYLKVDPPSMDEEKTSDKITEIETYKNFKRYIPLIKANKEERTVTGIVLQPEIVDAQGDIISKEVIKKAAHEFMADFNKKTKLGFMHKIFTKNFELCQSYIAVQNFMVNGQVIPEGSWVMVVKVVDAAVWKLVKAGKIKGFSIGGKAKVIERKVA